MEVWRSRNKQKHSIYFCVGEKGSRTESEVTEYIKLSSKALLLVQILIQHTHVGICSGGGGEMVTSARQMETILCYELNAIWCKGRVLLTINCHLAHEIWDQISVQAACVILLRGEYDSFTQHFVSKLIY